MFPGGCYDVVTCGAFTAYPQKYRQGGLRRMMKQASESTENGGQVNADKMNEILNSMSALKLAIHQYCEAVCLAAIQGNCPQLSNSATALGDKACISC